MRYSRTLFVLTLFLAIHNVAPADEEQLRQQFDKHVQPFLTTHCARCHKANKLTSGIRVDHLDSSLQEGHLKLWKAIQDQLELESMPPEDVKQPTRQSRKQVIDWIEQGLKLAKSRPTPMNGGARRLTAAQYANTLRELLQLEDNLTDILPADAVSHDGFVNNRETLELSPLLLETYIEIAERALDLCIVDPESKPTIQSFQVDLGKGINPQPLPERLILGANSLLLDNQDFVVREVPLEKNFAFNPLKMRTKYRFNEGYQGNSTVRGWRDYDSIYHAVFACMRGKTGYPKGHAYETTSEGLLLRPAIPSAELFGVESTYGPHANFKISLRELPDDGRFRVTVTAAKVNDGLLLDPGSKPQTGEGLQRVDCPKPQTATTVIIPQAGVYQIDVHTEKKQKSIVIDDSRLDEGLIGAWSLDGSTTRRFRQPNATTTQEVTTGQLSGDAKYIDTPFGKGVTLDGNGDSVVIPRDEAMNVGDGAFTVAAWIRPKRLRQAGIVCLGKYSWTHGWYLDMPNNRGVLRIETASPGNQSNGTVQSPPRTIRANVWQHIAAVVRDRGETRLYVNGDQVAQGKIGKAVLDNPKVQLHLGRIQDAQQFFGDLDEVRIYRRALGTKEIQALVEPGRKILPPPPPPKPEPLKLVLGSRSFSGVLNQPAFLVARLPAGKLAVVAQYEGMQPINRITLTRLPDNHELSKRFARYEQRHPHLGVHLGLRRDCGSTFAQVGSPQTVTSEELTKYTFTGAIRNFPSPEVQKDNDNYLAGIREIGVRSEYTDGRDMPRLRIRSVSFEGPYYETWPPQTHHNIFLRSENASDELAYGREVISHFAARAFRRPLAPKEEASLLSVFQQSMEDGRSFRDSVRDALLVVLCSPQFLFLIEHSSSPKPEPLDEYELASKLSYFLWDGPPDQKLLELAANDQLRQQLLPQTTRLMQHQKFSRFTREFGRPWLSLDKFDVLEPDRKLYPKLTRKTRESLREQPIRLLEHLVEQNLSVRNLIASDFIVANEVVADYYDLADKCDSGFHFVAIPTDRSELGGLFGQAAIMAGLSDGRESNPIKRGAWVARKIVAKPPDDPPPNVPELEESTEHLPLAERLARHRNQTGCIKCHEKIDPWGLPLEEYNAGGRFKKAADKQLVKLPDETNVADAAELKSHLSGPLLDQVAFSVLKHLTTYATGRTLSYNELEYLRREGLRLKTDGYRMRDMVLFVVSSPMFLNK